ncbi:MAG: alpha/beta hydrolase [Candidatus Methanofastidiosia archaeon]|jgi:esterase/lipase
MSKLKFGVGRSPYSFGVFKDHETDWFFKRTLEYMNEKAAEIGECLYVARKIDETDGESWITEWASLAERVENQGKESLRQTHVISARESFLRASNYYRAAEYGCLPSHPRFHELWEKSRTCFHAACPLFDPPIEIIEVPFEGKYLPGYYWRPTGSDGNYPTLICVGGNDSSGEEVVFITGPAAVRRGYNFFTFEFPGHRGAVHLYPDCVKRPDYEVPFKAAIDFLETLPGTDERIALTGFSFGGYVTSRVAVHEPRIQAVIPNSPLINTHKASEAMGGSLFNVTKVIPDQLLNAMMNWKLRKSPLMKSLIEYSLWTYGWGDIPMLEAVRKGRESPQVYTIEEDLHKITCAALVLVSEDEGEELMRQAKQFYDGISSKNKKMHVFSMKQDGSNDHCQLDNRSRGNQIMFDWLDTVFND